MFTDFIKIRDDARLPLNVAKQFRCSALFINNKDWFTKGYKWTPNAPQTFPTDFKYDIIYLEESR
jgi:hypothetical protein